MNLSAESSRCSDSRRTPRERVSTSAALRGGGTRALADVLDISVHGARLSTAGPLIVGSRISLKLPLVESIEATVVWVDDFQAGCEFIKPLHSGEFRTLLHSAS